jgi:hypothetical protein
MYANLSKMGQVRIVQISLGVFRLGNFELQLHAALAL